MRPTLTYRDARLADHLFRLGYDTTQIVTILRREAGLIGINEAAVANSLATFRDEERRRTAA